MLQMLNFCILVVDGGEEKEIEDDKMLIFFLFIELGKLRGRVVFYLGLIEVISLDFFILNYRYVRIYQMFFFEMLIWELWIRY